MAAKKKTETVIHSIKGFDANLACRDFQFERWEAVPGFAYYEVSDLGRVRSLPRSTATGVLGGRLLKPDFVAEGYARVTFSVEGTASRHLVHRLVLMTFRGPSALECRHLNGNSRDNRLCNLAWGTRSENAHDRVRHGTQYDNRGERHGNARLTDKQAMEIRDLVRAGAELRPTAELFHTSIATVSRIANGTGWRHLGGDRG